MPFRIFLSFDLDHDRDLCEQMLESSGSQRVYEIAGRSQGGAMSGPWLQRTQGQIAKADRIHPNSLSQWKQTFLDRGAEIFEVIPILFVDPIVDFIGTYDIDVRDVGFQDLTDPLANITRGTRMSIFV